MCVTYAFGARPADWQAETPPTQVCVWAPSTDQVLETMLLSLDGYQCVTLSSEQMLNAMTNRAHRPKGLPKYQHKGKSMEIFNLVHKIAAVRLSQNSFSGPSLHVLFKLFVMKNSGLPKRTCFDWYLADYFVYGFKANSACHFRFQVV